MIVLDTHVLLWWTLEPARLSVRATHELAQATELGIPSIVFWEVSLLARRKKVVLGSSSAAWAESVLAIPRSRPLVLTPQIAIKADELDMHADPADRFIAATAIEHKASLLSKDRLLSTVAGLDVMW